MKMTAHGPDELVAALPHLLGFSPEESMVLVPFSPGLPVARIDLPRDEYDRSVAVAQLAAPFLRHAHNAGPDPKLAVVCLTEDGQAAASAATAIAAALTPRVAVPLRLWASDQAWTDLDTGKSGPRSNEATTRFAAEAVASGRQLPARAREDLQRSLVGDRAPVAAAVPAAIERLSAAGVDVERCWVEKRVHRFVDDGIALSDSDAARLLVSVQVLPVRDAAWAILTQDEHHAHRALWTDLTRRAPDEVRTPAATLLAFSAWLGGDGAGAWTALDQIPDGQGEYRLAALMASVLEGAVPPSQWMSTIRPALLEESKDLVERPELGLDRPHDLEPTFEPDMDVVTDRRRRPPIQAPVSDPSAPTRPPTR